MLLVSLKFDLVPAALASLGLVLVFLFLRLLEESSQMQSFVKEIPRIFFRVKSTLDLTNLNRFLLDRDTKCWYGKIASKQTGIY